MRWQIAVLVLCLALVWGCVIAGRAILHAEREAVDLPASRSASQTRGLPTPAESTVALEALRLVDRVVPHKVGYARAAFGSGWLDTDRNGCNQRDDVLLRDAVPGTVRVVRQGRCDHDVVAGQWVDPYTGQTLIFDDLKEPRQAQAIQIDHVVPLAEAWVSGARRWSDHRRRAFANDLDTLLAVHGPINASKGDGDPAAWRPKAAYQCDYARRWIEIKSRWQLSADRSETRALAEMLAVCDGSPP